MVVMSFKPKPMGGAEHQCFRLSKELQYQGIDLFILTQGERALPRFQTVDGIPVYRLYSFLDVCVGRVSRFVWPALRTMFFRARRPDIPNDLPYDPKDFGIATTNVFAELISYIVFFLNALPFLWSRKKDFQLIHVHVIPWISFVSALIGYVIRRPVLVKESTSMGLDKFLDYPFGKFMLRYVVNHCYFVAMTMAIHKNLISHGVAEVAIFNIPNGVSIPGTSSRTEGEGFRCLFVGNLSQGAAKGLDVLLLAWKSIVADFPHAELLIVGNGNGAQFNPYVAKLGVAPSVRFLGTVQNPDTYYECSSIFALPSRREGMSNALLEAMSHGLPVVATRISGNEDLIEHQVNGLLIPTDDPDALANSIAYLFSHAPEAALMGQRARLKVEELCSIDVIARRYIQAYEKIISET